MKFLKISTLFLCLSLCISLTWSKTWVINTDNYSFNPASISVSVGDTIQWQWVEGKHTTTSLTVPTGAASWDSPITSSSPSFMYIITVKGTYNYECTPHEDMNMQGSFDAK